MRRVRIMHAQGKDCLKCEHYDGLDHTVMKKECIDCAEGVTVSKGFQRQEDILTAADGMTTEEAVDALNFGHMLFKKGIFPTEPPIEEAVRYIEHGRAMSNTLNHIRIYLLNRPEKFDTDITWAVACENLLAKLEGKSHEEEMEDIFIKGVTEEALGEQMEGK
jgi:hypothetical protein